MNHNIVDAVPMPEPTPKRPTPGVGLNLPPLRRLNAPVQPPSAQMPPVAQPPQQQPPMPPVDFNQLPEFFRRDDPYRLNPSAVQLQREMLLREIGPLTLPSLECFVQVLFNDDLVVESYIRPKPLARIFHRSRATNEYGIALVCPKIQVSNLDQRAGNAEAKLYRRN